MKPTQILVRSKDKKTGLLSPVIQVFTTQQDAKDQYIKNMLFGQYSSDILLFQVGIERSEIKMSEDMENRLKNGEAINPLEPISSTTITELMPVMEDITPYEDVEIITHFYNKYSSHFQKQGK